MQNEEEVNKYVELYSSIESRLHGKGKTAVAIAIMQEISKDMRMELMASIPATEKQKIYLKDLGVEIPDKLTRDEASRLIDKAKEKKQ